MATYLNAKRMVENQHVMESTYLYSMSTIKTVGHFFLFAILQMFGLILSMLSRHIHFATDVSNSSEFTVDGEAHEEFPPFVIR